MVSSVQLPTGDANDWLGKEPDIDETAITRTVDTDITSLCGAESNGSMFAAAYAAANGLVSALLGGTPNVQDPPLVRRYRLRCRRGEAGEKPLKPHSC